MNSLLRCQRLFIFIALWSISVSAQTPAPTTTHDQQPRYFSASQVNWIPLLPPPPAADSPQQQRDLQAVLELQAANQQGTRREQAIADAEASCFRFADVLGPAFNAGKLPQTAAFLERAAKEGNAATGILKRYWQRPRPFVVSDKVERLADISPLYLAKLLPAATQNALGNSSYPSGHATYGTLCAILLSQMVPEKQAPLFQRALDYGESRVIVGAHFPSDVLAGKVIATAAAAVMSQNTVFQHDLSIARGELRTALGLSVKNSGAAPQ